MEIHWNLIQFAGFLDSWSATQRYKAQNEHHPLDTIWDQLLRAWGDENEALDPGRYISGLGKQMNR
jgi:hypothetical protein